MIKRTLNLAVNITIGLASLIAVDVGVASTMPFNHSDQQVLLQHLLHNIATTQNTFVKNDSGRVISSMPGAVLASPSNKGPVFDQDYQFHWVRDAAITMNQLVSAYQASQGVTRDELYRDLLNYVSFEQAAQQQTSNSGEETLGQPKYNFDGTIWEGQWGRPQNDGPALRALALMRISQEVLPATAQAYRIPAVSNMIYLDLDYLIMHWQATSFDLWEEVNDQDHFFNKMVQRKALMEGAHYAERLGDRDRALRYRAVAGDISKSLARHWNPARGYLSETIYQQDYKGGGLNASIILGALHGNLHEVNDPYAITSHFVQSTVFYLRNAFAGLYPVNFEHPELAPLIGRYPNDMYDGDRFLYGNPWILLTNALAQYYYECAMEYQRLGVIEINSINLKFFRQLRPTEPISIGRVVAEKDPAHFERLIHALFAEGDRLMRRVKSYGVCEAGQCLHFAEQIDRSSGQPVSAKDLTWNYGSLLAALEARASATRSLAR